MEQQEELLLSHLLSGKLLMMCTRNRSSASASFPPTVPSASQSAFVLADS